MSDFINGVEPIIIREKPNYGKVIAITAVTVAVVEAAVIAAIAEEENTDISAIRVLSFKKV